MLLSLLGCLLVLKIRLKGWRFTVTTVTHWLPISQRMGQDGVSGINDRVLHPFLCCHLHVMLQWAAWQARDNLYLHSWWWQSASQGQRKASNHLNDPLLFFYCVAPRGLCGHVCSHPLWMDMRMSPHAEQLHNRLKSLWQQRPKTGVKLCNTFPFWWGHQMCFNELSRFYSIISVLISFRLLPGSLGAGGSTAANHATWASLPLLHPSAPFALCGLSALCSRLRVIPAHSVFFVHISLFLNWLTGAIAQFEPNSIEIKMSAPSLFC